MPMQPGTFFAALLIVVSLATNIVYFADFRESILAGYGSAAASVSAENTAVPDLFQIEPLPRQAEQHIEKKSESRVNLPIPMTREPFLQPSAVFPSTVIPSKDDNNTGIKKQEPAAAVTPPVTVSQVPVPKAEMPKAQRAEPAEAIANQFQPVMQPPAKKPAAIPQVTVPQAKLPKKYSSDAVWINADSVLEVCPP
ncbi:MAG: hypothetical protein LBT46_09290 [Planctomycetaceae bacterium]|nr:hypothetical protein [Planctomycetaceae bacterium]